LFICTPKWCTNAIFDVNLTQAKRDPIMPDELRSARLATRLSPPLYALLKRAAELEGRSMSDFVLDAATAAAKRTLEQETVIKLSRENSIVFAALAGD
jgi:uncharacterized protein (DUF1778 family)